MRKGNKMLAGIATGALATVPMTLFMLWANRTVPARRPDPLPPEEITRNVTERVTGQPIERTPEVKRLSLVSHFSYGGLAGLPLALFNPSPGNSILYGLAVWSGSYLGWLPAVRLYPSAKDEPSRMNAIMILAHVIWGGTAGWSLRKLAQPDRLLRRAR